jgi:hypothetical protein
VKRSHSIGTFATCFCFLQQKNFDYFFSVVKCGVVKRSQTSIVLGIDVGPVGDQEVDDRAVTVDASHVQGSQLKLVSGGNPDAPIAQEFYH